ncbi:MAG: TonB-dependent receptor, partial [Silanimonas sp.]
MNATAVNRTTAARRLPRHRLSLALAVCLATAAAPAAFANDGALVGRVTGENGAPVANAAVTVRNPATGLERSVSTNANGEYRFPFLPVGGYTLRVDGPGEADASIADVRVVLGAATNLPVSVGATTLAAVEVSGARLPSIDVSSVESATNFTAEDVARLPVARDASAVALLTPGVNKGDPDLGGISFGGSSIAENTVYINGLNVTDFYNRVGFSSVPFAFFQEFQVKTGGYSVEFGRTTGGVINAVTKSGTNEFHAGAELVWEPAFLQTSATDRFDTTGNPVRIASYDQSDRLNINGWASGALIQDRLFFYAIYEARDLDTEATNSAGNRFNLGGTGDDFWGAKFDWQLNDSNLVELLAFSDDNSTVTRDLAFDLARGERGAFLDRRFSFSGGDNHAITWTSYLADNFSAKLMAGGNDRQSRSFAQSALDCSRIRDRRT